MTSYVTQGMVMKLVFEGNGGEVKEVDESDDDEDDDEDEDEDDDDGDATR